MSEQPPTTNATTPPSPMLHAQDTTAWTYQVPTVAARANHNVFDSPDLLVRLFMHQTELGYKVGALYITCVTIYVALTGFTVQQYFTNLKSAPEAATRIAVFGLLVSILSLAAPYGLRIALRHIRRIAKDYSDALELPAEEFAVIRFGEWLSLAAFIAIALGWSYLLLQFR